MRLISLVAVSFLLIAPGYGGVKDLASHFQEPGGAVEPRSLDHHGEDTVTSDLPLEGFEDEDYIDFDKLLAEGEDDYSEGDRVDELTTPPPGVSVQAEPFQPKARRAALLRLFHGRSRLQRLNGVNARFGLDLYRSVRNHANASHNILLAPAGVSVAMGMMALAGAGRTREQLYAAAGFDDFVNASRRYDNGTVHKLFRKLTHRLFRRNFGYTLRSVNDLYVRKEACVEEAFRADTKAFYFAEPQSVDFREPAFLEKANRRISKMTKGLIKEPLKSVSPDMTLMLLNYLYFKGTWEQKFPKEGTHYRNFRVSEKQSVRVPMMQNKGSYLATTDHELQCDVLRLPYAGNISMIVALPRKISGMRALEKEISPTVLNKWLDNMTNRTREVVFPRFNLEQKYDIIDNLKEMGVTDPFEETADFSRMTTDKIAINWFKHQGTIMVNEEGTEAAALTQVGFMPLSSQIRFVVDRPFLFLIYEHRTDCLVFVGRVVDPSRN